MKVTNINHASPSSSNRYKFNSNRKFIIDDLSDDSFMYPDKSNSISRSQQQQSKILDKINTNNTHSAINKSLESHQKIAAIINVLFRHLSF